MSSAPLITIITVTFNAEKEILPTLLSVDEQGFRDYEHLIIDGASSDRTLNIIEDHFSEKRKTLSEPDKGLYDAMNKGLSLARGKYVVFLNAGDSFSGPDILECYATEALKDRDIIFGDTEIVNIKREIIGPRHLSAPEKLTFRSFSKGMLICHQAFMVKKSKAPEYDLQYKFSSDYDWTLKCIRNSNSDNCSNLRRVTIHYLKDGMTDKNKKASLKERYHIMAHHYGTFPTLLNHISFLFRAARRRFTQ